MKFRVGMMLALLALVGGAKVQAQGAPHVCGAGPGPNEVQAGVQPGGNGMAPTPLCYWKSQSQQQQTQQSPSQPTGYWKKTWGAIAPSSVGGVLGTALGAGSKEEAERLALEDCKAKGGAACKVEMAYHNQCGAMIVGKEWIYSASAASVEEAEEEGIRFCSESDTDCRAYYSACTEPIFHHY